MLFDEICENGGLFLRLSTPRVTNKPIHKCFWAVEERSRQAQWSIKMLSKKWI